LEVGFAGGVRVSVVTAGIDCAIGIGDVERPPRPVQGAGVVILGTPLPDLEVVERLPKLAPLRFGGRDDSMLGVAASGPKLV